MAMPVACRTTAEDERPTDKARAATQLRSTAHTAPVPHVAGRSPCKLAPSKLTPAGPAAAKKRGAGCEGAMKALGDSTYHAPTAMAKRQRSAGESPRAMARRRGLPQTKK